jgi:hypothetical protein
VGWYSAGRGRQWFTHPCSATQIAPRPELYPVSVERFYHTQLSPAVRLLYLISRLEPPWAESRKPRIINLSLGIERDDPNGACPTCTEVRRISTESAIMVVAAAGNTPGAGTYPAQDGDAVAVGALDYEGVRLADYSNTGDIYSRGSFTVIPIDEEGRRIHVPQESLPGGVDSLEPKFPTAIVDIIADLYFHLFKLRNVDYRAMTFGLCARQGTRLLYPASLRERRRRQPLLATVRLEATATCDNTCDLPSPAVRRRELREAGGRPVATPGV